MPPARLLSVPASPASPASPAPSSPPGSAATISTSPTSIPDPHSPTPPFRRPPSPHPDRAAQTTIRNRRLCYLRVQGDAYFSSPDLELADPLLYDRLIRRFQSAAEREAQGRARGWSGVLEADLTRAEAKIAARSSSETTIEAGGENEFGEEVTTREEGEEMWRRLMTWRFLEGKDTDADYENIDRSEELDDRVVMEREAEEKWFDAESPSEVSGAGDTGVLDY